MKRQSGKTYPNPKNTPWEEVLSTPDFSKDEQASQLPARAEVLAKKKREDSDFEKPRFSMPSNAWSNKEITVDNITTHESVRILPESHTMQNFDYRIRLLDQKGKKKPDGYECELRWYQMDDESAKGMIGRKGLYINMLRNHPEFSYFALDKKYGLAYELFIQQTQSFQLFKTESVFEGCLKFYQGSHNNTDGNKKYQYFARIEKFLNLLLLNKNELEVDQNSTDFEKLTQVAAERHIKLMWEASGERRQLQF